MKDKKKHTPDSAKKTSVLLRYKFLSGARKSALRSVWHQTRSLPGTTEEQSAHEQRRKRILDRITALQIEKVTPIWKRKKYTAAAAIAILFFSVGYFLYYRSTPTIDKHQLVSSASNRHIVLPDSTRITLAPYSTLSWQEVAGKFDRKVFLQGKATFAVTRKMHQDFTVKTAHMGVRVLGTVFTVEDPENSKAQKVNVQEGKVAVDITASSGSKSYTLIAGQQLTNVHGSTEVSSEPKATTSRDIRHIKLEGSTLSQLAQQLSQVYKTEVYVAPAIRNTGALTADFEDLELEQVLKLVSRTIAINYSIEDNKVYISQKK